jgi:hypothetical protein
MVQEFSKLQRAPERIRYHIAMGGTMWSTGPPTPIAMGRSCSDAGTSAAMTAAPGEAAFTEKAIPSRRICVSSGISFLICIRSASSDLELMR